MEKLDTDHQDDDGDDIPEQVFYEVLPSGRKIRHCLLLSLAGCQRPIMNWTLAN
jgi:hypothetical protein